LSILVFITCIVGHKEKGIPQGTPWML